MAWINAPHGTAHTHQVIFGRKVEGCPRCEELKAGAPARAWGNQVKFQKDAQASHAIADHFASHKHRSGGCGPVCTFGEW